MTGKSKVLSQYPNAVAESTYDVCDPDGRVISTIWSAPKDLGTTGTQCRYLLGTGMNETQTWHNASIGVDNLRQLMEDVCSN